jgi:hypothetical protein
MQQASEPDADELFEMANLFPRTTGLPMTVWVSPRGNARHDVWVKVNMTHGDQMNIANTAIVTVHPSPHVIAGHLPSDDQRAVFEWVSLNTDAIVEYWDGRIDTIELGQLLKRVPPRQPGGPVRAISFPGRGLPQTPRPLQKRENRANNRFGPGIRPDLLR